MFKESLQAGRHLLLIAAWGRRSLCLGVSFHLKVISIYIHREANADIAQYGNFWNALKHTHTSTHCFALCIHVCHIQTLHSITDELLPAHDKSSPVCGISVFVHVGAHPDPTASALSPTTWGPAWMTDRLIGRSHLTKRISDWSPRFTWAPEGVLECQRPWASGGCTFSGLFPPDFLGQIS